MKFGVVLSAVETSNVTQYAVDEQKELTCQE